MLYERERKIERERDVWKKFPTVARPTVGLVCSGPVCALAVPGRMACSALRLRSLLDPIYQGRVDVVHWTTIDISCGEKFSGIQRLLC